MESTLAMPYSANVMTPYRGRIAPSPSGLLHLGHARTFWIAYQRAKAANGTLLLRNEDLDPQRSKPEFACAMVEDLRWLGIEWQEGLQLDARGQLTEVGAFGPYTQSARRGFYLDAWRRLLAGGFLYPCICSRKDLARMAQAPHEGTQADVDDEPVYPGTCRNRNVTEDVTHPAGQSWRFRVPDGEEICFTDLHLGSQRFVAGRDFGDFLVWRRDDVPAYQLACVVDDAAMQITEVVRGCDLLKSTARQMLLQRALGLPTPQHYHCDLMLDEHGQRLAKRQDALSLRALREQGVQPRQLVADFQRSAL
ncbi:MAG: tRNA glutamyl-Q(34) synthetase GluQRS [Acidobacteriaceae bacterium]